MSVGSLDPVFRWATDELDNVGNPTKSQPETEFTQTGLIVRQPWPRLWLNYAHNNHGEYINHLINEPVGTIRTMMAGVITDSTDEWGGTWAKTTDTIGGKSVDVFEKTGL